MKNVVLVVFCVVVCAGCVWGAEIRPKEEKPIAVQELDRLETEQARIRDQFKRAEALKQKLREQFLENKGAINALKKVYKEPAE